MHHRCVYQGSGSQTTRCIDIHTRLTYRLSYKLGGATFNSRKQILSRKYPEPCNYQHEQQHGEFFSFLASFPVTCEYVTYSEKWYKGKRVNVLLVRITHQDFGAVAA